MANDDSRPVRRAISLEETSVEELLGRIIINWNNFEAICRELLCQLCGRPPGIAALTNELHGSTLYLALKASASDNVAPELEETVTLLSNGLCRLIEHRNYYVHGSTSYGGQTGQESLRVRTSSAKAQIKVYEDDIDKRELYEIGCDCAELGMIAADVTFYLIAKRQGQPVSLPDKPFLPPRLRKSRLP
ncbi:hypothetical protein [Affinirhizobium pseudoryzae]|uniref:hypothetical protein n=1 Tax=Allorhizobium pseudoryzae TaxID=379684 RepID=UPI0013EA99DF|nr:hypothetical protein [Allorhizobium pseudoryzae]